jgi:F0F1-type ATP synthase assembly protein I
VHQLYKKLYAISIAIIGIIVGLTFFIKPNDAQLHQDFLACFLFYALLSPAVYAFSIRGTQSKKSTDFLTSFYGGFMLKLFLSLLFVMIYFSLNKNINIQFMAAFGLCYFAFSGIETLCLMKASKNANKK